MPTDRAQTPASIAQLGSHWTQRSDGNLIVAAGQNIFRENVVVVRLKSMVRKIVLGKLSVSEYVAQVRARRHP